MRIATLAFVWCLSISLGFSGEAPVAPINLKEDLQKIEIVIGDLGNTYEILKSLQARCVANAPFVATEEEVRDLIDIIDETVDGINEDPEFLKGQERTQAMKSLREFQAGLKAGIGERKKPAPTKSPAKKFPLTKVPDKDVRSTEDFITKLGSDAIKLSNEDFFTAYVRIPAGVAKADLDGAKKKIAADQSHIPHVLAMQLFGKGGYGLQGSMLCLVCETSSIGEYSAVLIRDGTIYSTKDTAIEVSNPQKVAPSRLLELFPLIKPEQIAETKKALGMPPKLSMDHTSQGKLDEPAIVKIIQDAKTEWRQTPNRGVIAASDDRRSVAYFNLPASKNK